MAPDFSASDFVVETLARHHDFTAFDCGNEALNSWLKRFAWTNVRNDSARVYVLHTHDDLVLGYHAITVGSVSREEVPGRVSAGLAAHPIGVALLARLAVDRGQQGKGFGVTLLQDALRRIEQAAELVAVRAVLVHAINDQARNFYLRYGFSPCPGDDMRLIILMKDLRALLRTQ